MTENAVARLTKLLDSVGAYDHDEDYVHFDRVWRDPGNLRLAADITTEFLLQHEGRVGEIVRSDPSNLVLLSPDPIKRNFGIIPVSTLVSQELGCRFAVWKEMADIRLGRPAIMGATEVEDLNCVVLQDVVHRGYIAPRVAHALLDFKWHFVAYVAAVLNQREGIRPIKRMLQIVDEISGELPEFEFIVSADSFRQ